MTDKRARVPGPDHPITIERNLRHQHDDSGLTGAASTLSSRSSAIKRRREGTSS